jgi:hypothetical protein
MAFPTREEAIENEGKEGREVPKNPGTGGDGSGPFNEFYGGGPVSDYIARGIKGPYNGKYAVTPHNIFDGIEDGFHGCMDMLAQRLGYDPRMAVLPTEEAAGVAAAVSTEVKTRAEKMKEYYEAIGDVAKVDADTFEQVGKMRVKLMNSTLDQAQTAMSMGVAALNTHTKYAGMARKYKGIADFHRGYNKTLNDVAGKRIAARI